MARMAEIKGLAKLKSKLVLQSRTMNQRLSIGLERCGLLIQRESMKLCPVDTGNLRASAFTRVRYRNTPAVEVRVGYTAAYALYVHENLDALHGAAFNEAHADRISGTKGRKKMRKAKGVSGIHNPFDHSRGENQQAKFLEQPARELQPEMRAILREAMKTK